MSEWRLFPENTIPEYTTAEWYISREHAPHLEQEGNERLVVASEWASELISSKSVSEVVDLGAGDGGLLSTLSGSGAKLTGFDLMPTNVSYANEVRKVPVLLKDIVNEFPDEYFHGGTALVVATEMLEHLINPHEYVRKIRNKADFFIASSPWHETDLNHYPFHTWAWDEVGYRVLLEQAGFKVLKQEIVAGAQLVLGV